MNLTPRQKQYIWIMGSFRSMVAVQGRDRDRLGVDRVDRVTGRVRPSQVSQGVDAGAGHPGDA